jgi:transposase-like protein
MSIISKQPFHDEEAAFAYLEKTLWPNGPVCPHCKAIGSATKLQGKATRIGVWKCKEKDCRKQFTVKVGTVFEHGRMPLHKMLQAVYLLCCSKKGISAHQLHRVLQITYKSAWFLAHRIREAMRDGSLPPMGGDGKVVETDETYFGMIDDKAEIMPREEGKRGKRAGARRSAYRAVVALVERGGAARTFHVEQANQETVHAIMRANIAKETRVHTDESGIYKIAPWYFAKHETVKHSAKEYARGDVTTNSVEGYFSIFKRGMIGVYQHCSEKHLHRYLAEFDFRYSNRSARGIEDTERTALAIQGIVGKRLTYRAPVGVK